MTSRLRACSIRRALGMALGVVPGLLVALTARAEPELRDPTAWPEALRHTLAAARAASSPAATVQTLDPARPAQQILVRDGRSAVVVQGRSYRVGDVLDGARIQRIDEQAVWLQEGGKLRREPLYPGVIKRVPAAAAASPPSPAMSSAAPVPRAKNSKEKP